MNWKYIHTICVAHFEWGTPINELIIKWQLIIRLHPSYLRLWYNRWWALDVIWHRLIDMFNKTIGIGVFILFCKSLKDTILYAQNMFYNTLRAGFTFFAMQKRRRITNASFVWWVCKVFFILLLASKLCLPHFESISRLGFHFTIKRKRESMPLTSFCKPSASPDSRSEYDYHLESMLRILSSCLSFKYSQI